MDDENVRAAMFDTIADCVAAPTSGNLTAHSSHGFARLRQEQPIRL